MKTVRQLLLSIVLASLATLAWADPPARVGRLNYLNGTVSFATADAPTQWSYAVRNRPLTGGDRLWTDRDGVAELHVGSTAVRLDVTTSVDILHLDDDRIALNVARGRINLRVREMDATDAIELRTPAGTVVVRQPGSYRIAADDRAESAYVGVTFGAAEIAAGGYHRLLPAGQAARLHRHYTPAFEALAHAGPDEFERWSGERDRVEDRIASTRYVSPHMTGYEDLDAYGTWREEPEYGAVWYPSQVAAEWAPYRYGRWENIEPWGWTWIDDAPWGFAPFHYGRWVRVHERWAWAPGARVHRPAYAPALVAFVGGSGWSAGVGSGPAVGWFPLGWREPYRPWYRASTTYVQRVNVHHHHHAHGHHAHRGRPDAVTIVPQQTFASSRQTAQARLRVGHDELARAPVSYDRHPVEHRGGRRRHDDIQQGSFGSSGRSERRFDGRPTQTVATPARQDLSERERERIDDRERQRVNLEGVQRQQMQNRAVVPLREGSGRSERRFDGRPAQTVATPARQDLSERERERMEDRERQRVNLEGVQRQRVQQPAGGDSNDGNRRRRTNSDG